MGESEPPKTGPAYDNYVANRRRLVEIDDQISSILSNLTIGIRAEQNAQMARIKELRNEKAALTLIIFDSAVGAFHESGPVNRLLVEDLMRYANCLLYTSPSPRDS